MFDDLATDRQKKAVSICTGFKVKDRIVEFVVQGFKKDICDFGLVS